MGTTTSEVQIDAQRQRPPRVLELVELSSDEEPEPATSSLSSSTGIPTTEKPEEKGQGATRGKERKMKKEYTKLSNENGGTDNNLAKEKSRISTEKIKNEKVQSATNRTNKTLKALRKHQKKVQTMREQSSVDVRQRLGGRINPNFEQYV